jgi:hypothetical protein
VCNIFIVERNQSNKLLYLLGGGEMDGGSWSIVVKKLRVNINIHTEE